MKLSIIGIDYNKKLRKKIIIQIHLKIYKAQNRKIKLIYPIPKKKIRNPLTQDIYNK